LEVDNVLAALLELIYSAAMTQPRFDKELGIDEPLQTEATMEIAFLLIHLASSIWLSSLCNKSKSLTTGPKPLYIRIIDMVMLCRYDSRFV